MQLKKPLQRLPARFYAAAWEAGGAVMSEKRGLYISLALFLAFLLALPVSAASFAGAGGLRVVTGAAEPSALMTGRDKAGGAAQELLPGELIDINTADAAGLRRLPGIGEALSEAIVSYRQEHGAFQSIEAIMDVPGIGPGKFSAIEDNITIGD